MLHDIGKISIPSEILSKPGHINDIELLLIRSHPSLSFEILKQVEFPWPVARIAYQHHEKLDGSGYPEGIKGDDILLEAQIICVADVVEAISSHRPYRAGLGVISAMEYITEKKGSEFLDEVVDSCIKILDNGKYEFGEDQLPVIL
jgi:HD-GYP domain-containing protein (c-di-GMP phosphodiesterase class II)